MSKLLLVNTNIEQAPYPVPPVGICLLASVLSDLCDIKVYDSVFDQGEHYTEVLEQFNPDYIGFSIRNIDDMNLNNPRTYLDDIEKLFIRTTKECTDAITIVGGSGFSIFPEEIMNRWDIDFGIPGEGVEYLKLLIRALDNSSIIPEIPGLLTGSRGTELVQQNRSSERVEPVSSMDSAPSFHLPFSEIDSWIDFTPYTQRGVYSIQTKRGCYHNCIYCTYPVIEGKKYRVRSPECVADEIAGARERLGQVTFEFVDSTFNDPPGHAERICRAIIDKNLQIRLRTMGINPRHATDELFDLMRKAGFSQIDCTPDTASPVMLKNMGKNFTLEQLQNTADIIRDKDLPTMWFFIFGGPGETDETITESFDFIDQYIGPLDMVHMTTGLRIYPRTPLESIARKQGIISPGNNLIDPAYYISPALGAEGIGKRILEESQKRPNCVPSVESRPSREMMRDAVEFQKKNGVKEPMFRSLLRVRYKNFGVTEYLDEGV